MILKIYLFLVVLSTNYILNQSSNIQYVVETVEEYYSDIDTLATDDELKYQLKYLINDHYVLSYDEIWDAFTVVDHNLPTYPCSENTSYIPDVYSGYCWDPEKLSSGGECGNYAKEGDCYNREHLWPKSWFGGFDYGMNAQTDLFELWPTDGYVNGLRANYPLGNVKRSNVKYNSTNGSLLGLCDNDVYTSYCFEPCDTYKGDFARSYFYLSTAYADEWSCCDTDGVNGSNIKTWMEDILRDWNTFDPVDDDELERNDVIYELQYNRNPFIDYPEWVDQISDF